MTAVRIPPWVNGARWWLVCALPLLAHAADDETAKRGLTVEDFLRASFVGRSGLDPAGRLFVYEWTGRYDQAVNFGSMELLPEPMGGAWGKLQAVDLQTRAPAAPLFEQDPAAGYVLGEFSPDGARLAVYRLREGEFRAGVVELRTRRVKWFDFLPNWSRQFDTGSVWISPTELVYTTREPGFPAAILGQQAIALRAQQLWARSFAGKEPSATVLRSVADAPRVNGAYREGGLVRVDVATGQCLEMARGLFLNLRLSFDGRFLAGLRETGRLQFGATQESEAWLRMNTRELVVFDLRSGTSHTVPVKGDDVLLGTLNWAARGNRLTLLSRRSALEAGEVRLEISFSQFVAETGALHGFELDGLRPQGIDVLGPWSYRLHVADLGEKLVRLLAKRTKENSESPRWFEWQGAGPWTALAGDPAPENQELVGAGSNHWFTLEGGALFRHGSADGSARIDTGAAGPLRNWTRQGGNPSLSTHVPMALGQPLATQTVVLDSSDRVLILDVETAQITTVTKPSKDAVLRAVAPGKASAVFSQKEEGMMRFVSVREEKASPLFGTNLWMRSIVQPREVMLSFLASDGSTLSACLVLPPNWQPGSRLPLVVYVYPDVERGANRSPAGVLGALNFTYLTTHGFAVLYAPTPRRLVRTPDGPLKGLTPVILAAVDAAVREGYADGDRVGLVGISQGMHAVLQIATETDRIRTVVAMVGISDFSAEYFSNALRFRLDPDHIVIGGAGRFESESSSNFVGPKPWEDPQRYVTNSPVYSANRIKCPVLLIHCDLDYFAYAQSEAMFSALHRLKKEAEFVLYWGEGHGPSSPANIRDLWERLYAWYGKHLAYRPIKEVRLPVR